MLHAVQLVDRAIAALLKPVLGFGMAALVAVITLQIVSRVFFTAVGWTEEAARFLIVWLTFFGAVLAWEQRRHIAVAMLVERLPARLRHRIQLVAALVACLFMAALLWIGWDYMDTQARQRSASLRLPMSYVYLVIPISAGLMAWLGLSDLLRLLLGQSPPPQEGSSQ